MIVAALIDAGAPFEALRKAIESLPVNGFEISAQKIRKQGFAATKFDVKTTGQGHSHHGQDQHHHGHEHGHHQPHRHLKDIERIIRQSDLSESAKEKALLIFRRLAEAEAKAHGTDINQVHFHEVGAVDAIVDITAAVVGLELLGVERILCSPVAVGSGTVRCEHGTIPVPAPGTAALLEGVPIAECDEPGELLTPTGAAILTSLAERFGPMPSMRLVGCGYGAGTREGKTRPNLLRVFVGESLPASQADEVTVLEANLDDATGETIGHAIDRLLRAGALEAFCTPVIMKKGRPGVLLTVLCEPQKAFDLQRVLFAETPTFGIRRYNALRCKLQRHWQEVQTEYGTVRIKVGSLDGQVVSASPEYEDCRLLAEQKGAPLRHIMAAAMAEWRRLQA